MQITDVKIFPVQEERVRAYVTLTFDDSFVIRDVKVIEGPTGLFVSMPNKKLKDGQFRDVAHPKNQETREYIEEKILSAYLKHEDQNR